MSCSVALVQRTPSALRGANARAPRTNRNAAARKVTAMAGTGKFFVGGTYRRLANNFRIRVSQRPRPNLNHSSLECPNKGTFFTVFSSLEMIVGAI